MHVLLIGTGSMALEYVKVLTAMGESFTVFGRSEASRLEFLNQSSISAIAGDQDAFNNIDFDNTVAVVCVGIMDLSAVCLQLIESGCKRILLEKPGALSLEELLKMSDSASRAKTSIKIGLNRRFYGSTIKMREILGEDGGPQTFNFEFTEFSKEIEQLKIPIEIKDKWVLANSIHVIDLAFHLCGRPALLSSNVHGQLPWHKSARNYAGSGNTTKGALFCYSANWSAPGRWKLEITTLLRRILFQPLEGLQEFNPLSLKYEIIPLENHLDKIYKPGLYLQTKAFLEGEDDLICDISELITNWTYFCAIGNYDQ